MMHETPRASGSQATDAELLLRFCQQQDSTALGELVERHARMVLSVCRQALGHTPDADDAFQATFLILLRRADSIQRRGSVGSWLYRVAYRSAVRLARRRRRDAAAAIEAAEVAMHDDAWAAIHQQALVDALYEELDRLPERYRAPLVLFHLEGLSRREAAAALEITDATIKGLLVRGRRLLRLRLARRGVAFTLAAAAVGAATATTQGAEVARLVELTIDAATLYVHPPAAAGGSATVSHACQLADQGVRAMFVSTAVKFTAAGALAACVSLAWIARDTVVAAAGPGAAPATGGAPLAIEAPADDGANNVAEESPPEAIAVEFAAADSEPIRAADNTSAVDQSESVAVYGDGPPGVSGDLSSSPSSPAPTPVPALSPTQPSVAGSTTESREPMPQLPSVDPAAPQPTPAVPLTLVPQPPVAIPQYNPQAAPFGPPTPAAPVGEEERNLRVAALERSVRVADAMRDAYMTLSEAKQLESAAAIDPANRAMEHARSVEARGQAQMFAAEAMQQEVEKLKALAERARLSALATQPVAPTATTAAPATPTVPQAVPSYSPYRSAPPASPTTTYEPSTMNAPSSPPVDRYGNTATPSTGAVSTTEQASRSSIRSNATTYAPADEPQLDDQIRPGGRLHIEVIGTLPEAPILGVYQVEPGGTVALGAKYGRVEVADLTIIEAEEKLRKTLETMLANPSVQVTLPGTTPDNPTGAAPPAALTR